jgi:hypothetical protein
MIHLSETCDNTPDADGNTDPDLPPNLITSVVTTHAAVADQAMTVPIHQIAGRDLLAEHLMDAGYSTTAALLTCRDDGVRLVAPHRRDSSRHTRTGSACARDAFTIDFDQQHATCPQGHRSATWNPGRQDGHDVITVAFPLGACLVCPARSECTTSRQRRRSSPLRPRHLHEALQQARADQATDAWKHTYRAHAGIEGTIHQTVAVTGVRHARYTGLPKVELEHAFAATAVNLIRLNAWWTHTSLQRTPITHLARLNLTLAA